MYNSDEIRLFSLRANQGICSHAYIVDGENGIGKLDFALQCAKAILCTERSKPCGYCNSCLKLASSNHPDVFIIGKEKTASIDEVRELIRRASLKPNDSDKQVFIVCNAGRMGENAQNALLKLFEEPPESVCLFLLTENRSSLLPTVLSRGQRIHLDGMRDGEIEEKLLEKQEKIAYKELKTAIKLANGNYGAAEKYLSKESVNLRAKAETLLILALGKKHYELASALVLPKYRRDQLGSILAEFVSLVTEAQKSKYGVPANLPEGKEISERLASASKRALARMGEAALACMASLENNANVTAATSKLSIELLSAASR